MNKHPCDELTPLLDRIEATLIERGYTVPASVPVGDCRFSLAWGKGAHGWELQVEFDVGPVVPLRSTSAMVRVVASLALADLARELEGEHARLLDLGTKAISHARDVVARLETATRKPA